MIDDPQRHEIAEYETIAAVSLSSDRAAGLNQSKALNVAPSADGPDHWDITAHNYVGVVQAPGVEVRINPKVSVGRLMFMIAYAMRAGGWKDLSSALGEADDIVEAVAHALAYHSEKALAQGVLQGYITVDDALPGLRGRLREGDQLRRRFGLVVPLEVTFDDFTTNIPENRVLKSAAQRLLLLRSIPDETRRRLRRLSKKLEEVETLSPGEPIPSIRIDRRTRRYENALALADLVLRSMAVETGDASTAAAAFLFDMNKVFEDFVTRAFEEAFTSRPGRIVPQRVSYLDVGDSVLLKPDLTWVADGLPRAVIDLKYKSLRIADMPNADVYQMLAYCLALDLPIGHLVYAAGNEEPGQRVVRSSGTEITSWVVDLGQEPNPLLEQVTDTAKRIAATAPTGYVPYRVREAVASTTS